MLSPINLNAAQQTILAHAASQPDFIVLPLLSGSKLRGAARNRLLAGLVKQGLLTEIPTDQADRTWRQDAAGGRFTLRLTQAGRATMGVCDSSATPIHSERIVPAASLPTGKLGLMLAALSEDKGATLQEFETLTNWLPHTARAALTRLRQRGFPIARRKNDSGQTVYALAAGGQDNIDAA